MALIQIADPRPRRRQAGPRFALWDLGFRPFYLLASSFAAVSVLLWALQFSGLLPLAYLHGPLWHAHEMLFGFALAVVTGFLFTAGRNWTGQATPSGHWLAAMALLWVLGRVSVWLPYAGLAAALNLAFPLAAALGLGLPLYRARNRRNYFFVVLLVLMALGELVLHLGAMGVLRIPGWAGIGLGLDAMLIMLSVMAGRVIPMFTNNGVPGAKAQRKDRLEQAALAGVVLVLLFDSAHATRWPMALLLTLVAMLHLARWWLWQPWKTLRTPLVWVLHLAYAWIPVHLLLRAMAEFDWVASSVATHALTAGAIGCMVIGMMTRTALGHTGRPLRAGTTELLCYVLVAAAGLVRVVLPLLAPQWLLQAVLVSALLWAAGFGLYALRYWRILAWDTV